jgi:hypothetical protein
MGLTNHIFGHLETRSNEGTAGNPGVRDPDIQWMSLDQYTGCLSMDTQYKFTIQGNRDGYDTTKLESHGTIGPYAWPCVEAYGWDL